MNGRNLVSLSAATIFLGSALPVHLQAQPAREISGFVRGAQTNHAVPGATVTLESDMGEAIQQTSPEGSGYFLFGSLAPSIYYVSAQAPGFREVRQRADLFSQRRVSLQLFLVPDERAAPPQPPASVAVVSERDLRVPETARREFEKGAKLLREDKKPEKSLGHFRKAIEVYPEFAEAYFMLGTAYMDLQNWKEAQAGLEKAIGLNEKLAGAHLALGACHSQQGNFAAAEKPLARGLDLNPDSVEGQWEMGKVFWALDRWQEAESHARKAVALKPEFAAPHVLLGNILLRKRDARGALHEFKEYLRLEPQGPFAAGTREIAGRIEKALAAPP